LARRIRLRYTGLVVFASRIFSVFTGLAFLFFLTRNVTLDNDPLKAFGVWALVMVVVSYLIFPHYITNYWVTRDVARGFKVAKTSLVMSLAFSLLGFAISLIISPYIAKMVNADPAYFMVGSLILLAWYLVLNLEAIASGCTPHIIGYGSVTYEITRVILALILIVYLKTGLYGAFISIIIAFLAQAAFLLMSLRGHVTEGTIDLNSAKKWLKMFWVPLYTSLAPFLLSLDAFIVTLFAFSSLPLSLWRAALTFTTIVGYSTDLAFALYPKLLSGGSEQDVETSFKLVLMFVIPSATGALILAESLLQIFKREFVEAAIILRVNVLAVVLTCVLGILNSVIIGTEKVDIKEDASFKKLLKSRLFLLPTLSYVRALMYLPAICVISAFIVNLSLEPVYLNLPLACSWIGLFSLIPVFAYEYMLAKKILPFHFPVKSLAKYSLASVVLAGVTFLFHSRITVQTIASIFLGAFAYFSVLFIIDRDTRQLITSIISTFKLRNQ